MDSLATLLGFAALVLLVVCAVEVWLKHLNRNLAAMEAKTKRLLAEQAQLEEKGRRLSVLAAQFHDMEILYRSARALMPGNFARATIREAGVVHTLEAGIDVAIVMQEDLDHLVRDAGWKYTEPTIGKQIWKPKA